MRIFHYSIKYTYDSGQFTGFGRIEVSSPYMVKTEKRLRDIERKISRQEDYSNVVITACDLLRKRERP